MLSFAEKPVLKQCLAVLVTSVWKAGKSDADVVAWLDRQGVRNVAVVCRLQRVLDENAAEVVAADPYTQAPLLSWKRIDDLWRRLLRKDGRHPAVVFVLAQLEMKPSSRCSTGRHGMPRPALHDRGLCPARRRRRPRGDRPNAAFLHDGDWMRAPGAAGLEDNLTVRFAAPPHAR